VLAGVAQLAGFLLPLAACAGGGDEEPVRNEYRNQQCSDAFRQLPSCAHGLYYRWSSEGA
jgi:hypothetical protein